MSESRVDKCKEESELVLVTGASGYIATHLIKQLLELDYRVRGTVRSLKNEQKVAPLRKLVASPKHELELVEADLLDEKSWLNAVKDCTYVLHTASPFPNENPSDENELITPAVNGTLNVFKACVQDGSKVKRVVLTSSIAAVTGTFYIDGKVYTEEDWPETKNLTPYIKSKTLAEKAAWDFVKERDNCFELAVINPSYVMGPLLHDSPCTSTEVIKKLMNREVPMLPNITLPSCDVRDVALAHIRAMILPDAVSKRHIICSTKDLFTFKDAAVILDNEFKSKGYKVPTTSAPNFLIKVFSIFDKTARLITASLGVKIYYDNSRMVNVLGIQPIELKKTIIEMAYSLIERGVIPKKVEITSNL